MKKLLCLCILFAVLLTACSVGKVDGATVEYGESAVYTRADIDAAAEAVFGKFRTWGGCELYTLTYAGDTVSAQELYYCNSRRKEGKPDYTQCLVFASEFRSPKEPYGGWEADMLYYWDFHLARTDGGAWELIAWGYA